MLTSFQAWYYFCFGITLALYLFILFRKKDTPSAPPSTPGIGGIAPSSSSSTTKRIYLNLFFIDRTEFIHNIIRSKVPRSRPLVRALAKRAAVALLKDGIVTKVSQGLCKSLQERMEVMGIKCTITLAYNQAAYAALEMSFQTIDLYQFFLYGAGEEQAKKITNILNRYSWPAITEYLKKFLLGIVIGKLMVQLPLTIKEKLYNKMNTAIEIVSCTEEDQGPFFVQTLCQLNEKESVSAKDSNKPESSKESSTSRSEVPSPPSASKEYSPRAANTSYNYTMKQTKSKDSDDDDVAF